MWRDVARCGEHGLLDAELWGDMARYSDEHSRGCSAVLTALADWISPRVGASQPHRCGTSRVVLTLRAHRALWERPVASAPRALLYECRPGSYRPGREGALARILEGRSGAASERDQGAHPDTEVFFLK